MAVTKTNTSITQMTASGQSTVIDISDAYPSPEIYIHHVNGTGVTSAGEIQVQVRPVSSTQWYNLGGPIALSDVDSAEDKPVIALPGSAGDVRLDYTAPGGSSGHTLDAEVGEITGV